MTGSPGAGAGAYTILRRFARTAPAATEAEERCELCGMALAKVHRHLLEMGPQKITCACDPCALRFQNVIEGRFKLIPRDTRLLADFRLTDAMWENFALPINLAFFFSSTQRKKMTAMYPSPAGATESLLPLSAWEELSVNNAALSRMQPDVEALLVNRVRIPAYYLAPIDVCYELVGLIRMHWKGFSGSEEVWAKLDDFFARLKAESIPLRADSPGDFHA